MPAQGPPVLSINLVRRATAALERSRRRRQTRQYGRLWSTMPPLHPPPRPHGAAWSSSTTSPRSTITRLPQPIARPPFSHRRLVGSMQQPRGWARSGLADECAEEMGARGRRIGSRRRLAGRRGRAVAGPRLGASLRQGSFRLVRRRRSWRGSRGTPGRCARRRRWRRGP